MKNCKKCQTQIENKYKYCNKCSKQTSNKCSITTKKNRGYIRKKMLIETMGGICSLCKYSFNISAMCFHHKEPSFKSFHLDRDTLAKKPMNLIIEESKKCLLLCQNCHLISYERERNLLVGQKDITIKLKNKYKKRKQYLLSLKNNTCEKCGFVSDFIQCFHFHHIDPTTKLFHLNCTKLAGKNMNDILKEYEKCQLLCANCHMTLEYDT